MKKFFNYLGFLLRLEIEDGKAVYSDINFDPDLNEDDLKTILYEELLNFRIDLSSFSDFEKRVLKKVREIPSGNVMTYKEVAKAAGYRGASRAVGNVMAKNPFPILIPCHRVIKSDLFLGDYSRGGKKIK
ncbi:MAG: MGMT family protein, partial [Candidatus Hydrothermarchaeales archaeon]